MPPSPPPPLAPAGDDATSRRKPPLRPGLPRRSFLHLALGACATLPLGPILAGCGDSAGDRSHDERPLVVCTTTMIGDLATAVAGDDVRVEVLFGPDVDPHLFRPTRDDVALLLESDLVLWNGLHLEGYLRETLERLSTDRRVVAVAEEALTEEQTLHTADGAAPDPHAWMDVSLWARAAELVGHEVGGLLEDPSPVADRTAALIAALEALDARVAERLDQVPKDRRTLVTAHDAFEYFGRRYGFDVHAIQGISTASEAGLRAIEDLVDLVVDQRVPAVFFESTVAERSVRALVEGAAARGHTVEIGGTLHSDAPGRARTYVGMIEHNVEAIATALGAPTRAAGDANAGSE